ncbi:MAG: cob(I)yrinic acid a,c-diamide adenosyltransferase [Puniceicoccaceae bacterium]
MTGKVHIYTGDGKGKTTAALGLALRAAGHGMRSFVGQFMKGTPYGELAVLARIPEIEVVQFGWPGCVRKEDMGDFHRGKTGEGLAVCETKAGSGAFDLLILDEACVAVWFGLLDERALLDFVERWRKTHEIVLTGRCASPAILDEADLVTHMECRRHYFDKGVFARKGIER